MGDQFIFTAYSSSNRHGNNIIVPGHVYEQRANDDDNIADIYADYQFFWL